MDVNLYAYGKGAQALQGSHENIDIGGTIARALSLNLTDTTRLLNMYVLLCTRLHAKF